MKWRLAMVLIDTNVVSEPMCAAPSAEVLAWMDDLPVGSWFASSIKLGGLVYGSRRRGSGNCNPAWSWPPGPREADSPAPADVLTLKPLAGCPSPWRVCPTT